MPILDVTIPDGALTPDSEQHLLVQLMNILLQHEGADPLNPSVKDMSWTYLHRADLLVGGATPTHPRYRITATVPQGILSGRRIASLVGAITEAVLDAEPAERPRDLMRVWVLINTIPEGHWGAGGGVVGLADIAGIALGDAEAGRGFAAARLNRP